MESRPYPKRVWRTKKTWTRIEGVREEADSLKKAEEMMFGWFQPRCPCDLAAKRWVEDRLQWLAKQFGLHILLERPILLPTSEHFPDPWDGSPKAARHMFRRVCGYMHVDPDNIELKFFNDGTKSLFPADLATGFAVGTWSEGEDVWQKGVIRLGNSILDRPADLVGVMAHELSHQRLLGEGRIDPIVSTMSSSPI